MRSLWVRCLVALLVLALISGNAHAHLQLTTPDNSAPEVHQHRDAAEAASHHDRTQQEQKKASRCCCDALGCVTSYTLTPDLGGMLPVVFGTAIRYSRDPALLRGRHLLPEPEPPRPGTPS